MTTNTARKAPLPGRPAAAVSSRQREASSFGDTTVWLKIEGLEVDGRAQRPFSERRATKIAQEFDPDYVGVIHVSERLDGRKYIVDGQHRVGAMRILGWADQRVECKLYRGLTLAEEAKLFGKLNDFVRVLRFDAFMARITAREADAVAIDEIVRGCGLRWHRVAPPDSENCINCVAALESVYRGDAFNVRSRQSVILRETLVVAKAAWGAGHDSLRGDIIQGIGSFLLRYGDAVDRRRLRDRLAAAEGGALGLLGKARTHRGLEGGTVAMGLVKALVSLYNRGARKEGKLPDWQGKA